MKHKVLAIVVSLTLILSMVLPGTLAVSTAQDSATSVMTAADTTAKTEESTTATPTTGSQTEKKCNCTPVNGVHAAACPLYEVPKAGEKTADTTPGTAVDTTDGTGAPTEKTCNCGATGDTHAATCPLYVAPKTEETAGAPTAQPPAETEKTCTCGSTDGTHTAECALYVKPEETKPTETPVPSETTGNNPPVDPQPDATNGGTGAGTENGSSSEEKSDAVAPEEFTPKAAYDYLVLIQDDEKATKTYLDTLTDEQILALVAYLEPQKNTEGSLPYLLAYLELRFPPYEFLSCVNNTVAAPLVQAAIPRRMMFRAFAATQNDSGLETSKTVVKNADGSYTLRLEAYATGATYTTETSKPTDIVLVLDTSGSMGDYIPVASKDTVADLDPKYADYYKWLALGGYAALDMRYQNGKWQYKTVSYSYPFYQWVDCGNSWTGNSAGIKKIDALKIAVDGFLNSTAQNGGDNRVALVTYASGATTVNDLTDNFTSVKGNVEKLTANGATYADAGMSNAKAIVEGIPPERDSNKVVIMFTDGEPNHGSGFVPEVANAAIATSKDMKGKGVTVYTVGVMEGANNADTTSDFNRYMNYVSSNYPDAKSMDSSGEKYEHPDGGNYYLTADNLKALEEIFKSISNEVGGASNSTLDTSTVLKDIISDSFQFPDGADASSIAVYTANCTAINNGVPTFGADEASGLSASIAADGRTITVSGFDYSANYVGQNTTTGELHNPGKKLVVEIPIKVRTGFLGGNNVKTNGADSGVYDKDGSVVESFPVPQVNVPINGVTVTAENKNVYLLSNLTADQIKSGATVNCGTVALDLNRASENYGLAPWQTEYVDIAVEITDAQGSTVTNLSDLKNDTTYTITATVKPKTNGEGADGTPNDMDGKSGTKNADIFVFKPELTYKDSEVYYGDTAPTDFSENKTSEVWKHGKTVDASVTMIGDKPTLDITCTPESGKITNGKVNTKQDIAVDATVEIDGTDVTGYTTFQHTNCTDKQCGTPAKGKFWLHVKTCQLTIAKTGCEDIDENQSFIFDVTGPNGYSQRVVIKENDSVTIKDLPIDTYTITEVSSWSWRYSANGQTVTLQPGVTNEVTVQNKRNLIYWLNGCGYAQNIFG